MSNQVYSYIIHCDGQDPSEPMTAEQAAAELGVTPKSIRRSARINRLLQGGTRVTRVNLKLSAEVDSILDDESNYDPCGEPGEEVVRVRKDAVVYMHTWDEGMVLETESWLTTWAAGVQLLDDGDYWVIIGQTLEGGDA